MDFKNLGKGLKWSLLKIILPHGYPDSVSKDYWSYNFWLFFQRTISSVAYVMSTHSMLTAVGISASASISASVATTWVLKDGLGSLGMIYVANKYGKKIDINLKQSKWIADFLHVIGVAMELMTPLFPKFFLLLGSIANTAKGVAGLSNGAVRASINKNFALRENIGDVTAKSFSQGLVGYLLGMAGGIGLNNLLENYSIWFYFYSFFILGVLHSISSYYGTKVVILRNLDRQRFNILFDSYLNDPKTILNPELVNIEERFVWPFYRNLPDNIFLGESIAQYLHSESEILKAKHHLKTEKYYLIASNTDQADKFQINVFYSHSRSEKDIIKSFFHSKCIQSYHLWSDKEGLDSLETILQDSQDFVEKNFESFFGALKENGWVLEHQLLGVNDYLIVED